MSNIELDFSRPLLLLLIIPAIAVILLPFLHLPAKRRKNAKKIVPVVLHTVIAVLLTAILSGVSLVAKEDSQSLIILIDLSDSTSDVQSEMLSFASDLLERVGKDAQTGVISFADSTVYNVKLSDDDKSITQVRVSSGATDIAGALEYAATLLPTDTNRRIVLLSDGKQTDGNAEKAASALAKQGIRVDASYFETTYLNSSEIQVSDINMPSDAYVGDTVDITVTLESNVASKVSLVLKDNETEIAQAQLAVAEGENTYTFTCTADKSGVHSYTVGVNSESDTLRANNTMYSYLNVAGEASVLIVADKISEASRLEEILSAKYEVTVVNSSNAPQTLINLCNYDEVILQNVSTGDLPSVFGDLLKTYVESYGRSVLTVGGTGTYMYGGMNDTVYEEIMPVTLSMTDENAGQSVALMLVLDCSSSMSMTSTYLSLAKQGAIKSVEAMSSNDCIGIVSFNRSATLRSSLIQATDSNKEALSRIISGLGTSQGTYYTDALNLAYQELSDFDADVKHVIFLSDGNPNDSGYASVVQQMNADGITVSTVALGLSSSILSTLAEYGGGRYYSVLNASDLPNIMLSETEEVTVSSMINETVQPVIAEATDLTAGIENAEMPKITGYLGVTLKEDATLILSTEDEHPIYAEWQYGLGTVASFMSDLSGSWSAEWLSNEVGQLITERMVESTVSDTHHDSSLSAEITQGGKTAFISVTASETEGNQAVKVTASSSAGKTTEYTLTEIERGVYEGTVDTDSVGVYELMVIQSDTDGNLVDYLNTAIAVSYSSEYDAFTNGGEELLTGVTAFSGGTVTDSAGLLADIEMEPFELVKNPLVPLGIISAILLLADIVIRKLRWRDIADKLKAARRAAYRKNAAV